MRWSAARWIRRERDGMKPKTGRRTSNIYRLTLGALYVALFALAGNVPLLSAIQIIPGVPITLQVFLIAMMGLTLGLRGGMTAFAAVMVLTFCGLPMMAGGKGGPGVFVGPTGGYIIGWAFIVLLLGLYSSYGMDKLVLKKWRGMSIHLPVSFLIGMAGVLLDYVCGSLALAAAGGRALSELPGLLLANAAFLPGDMIKIGLASALSLSLFAGPVFRRLLHMERARG